MLQLNTWYESLHRFPECSRKEYKTAQKLTEWLTDLGLTVHRIGQTAVVGELVGGKEGKTVALRADMDALPITEQTGLAYASENDGVMHACGHDFHMTAVLGAAKILKEKQAKLSGKVLFVFQPDEEGDGYAHILSAHPIMKDVCMVLGAHVDPALPQGSFGFKSGAFYATATKFDITFIGKSAHGACPQDAIDALAAAAATVPKLLALRKTGENPAVISVGTFESGKARNIIAQTAKITGILRCMDTAVRDDIHQNIKQILAETELAYGAKTKLDFVPGYIGIQNPVSTTLFCKERAEMLFGKERTIEINAPLMTTEDFGEYLKERDGCFYHIGVGGKEGLHSAAFAPDPALLNDAAALHAQIITDYLKQE